MGSTLFWQMKKKMKKKILQQGVKLLNTKNIGTESAQKKRLINHTLKHEQAETDRQIKLACSFAATTMTTTTTTTTTTTRRSSAIKYAYVTVYCKGSLYHSWAMRRPQKKKARVFDQMLALIVFVELPQEFGVSY